MIQLIQLHHGNCFITRAWNFIKYTENNEDIFDYIVQAVQNKYKLLTRISAWDIVFETAYHHIEGLYYNYASLLEFHLGRIFAEQNDLQ